MQRWFLVVFAAILKSFSDSLAIWTEIPRTWMPSEQDYVQHDKEAFDAVSGTMKAHNFNYCCAFEINPANKPVLELKFTLIPPTTYIHMQPWSFMLNKYDCKLVSKSEKLIFGASSVWQKFLMPDCEVLSPDEIMILKSPPGCCSRLVMSWKWLSKMQY